MVSRWRNVLVYDPTSLPSTCSEHGLRVLLPLSFFLSFFLPVPSRRGTSLRNRGATGPSLPCWRTIASRCSIDPLDRAREEVAVGNLFILISVRHKLPTRGEEWRKSKASTAKRAVLLCQLLGDPRVYAINVICTPAWNFKRYS